MWEIASRGIHSRIVSDLKDDWGKARNCTDCGKCVQACPTGALAEKGFAVHEMVKEANKISRLAANEPPMRGRNPHSVTSTSRLGSNLEIRKVAWLSRLDEPREVDFLEQKIIMITV